MTSLKKINDVKKVNDINQIQLTENDLALFYHITCDNKDRDMSICPDCKFCCYFDLAREEFGLFVEKMPSINTQDYWMFAFSPTYRGEELSRIHTRLKKKIEALQNKELKTGKWLLFVKREKVDKIWSRIRVATENGSLGIEAKVSTAKQNTYNLGRSRRKLNLSSLLSIWNIRSYFSSSKKRSLLGRIFYTQERFYL